MQPSSPYLLVAGLGKLPEHLIQLGLVLLQVPILLAQLLLQHREQGISRAGSGVQASSHGRGNGGSCQHQGTCTGCALPAVRAECQSFFFDKISQVFIAQSPLGQRFSAEAMQVSQRTQIPEGSEDNKGSQPHLHKCWALSSHHQKPRQ